MTKKEIEIKAKEFDSKLTRHPSSSEELQIVLCKFIEYLSLPDFTLQKKSIPKVKDGECCMCGSIALNSSWVCEDCKNR